MFRDALFVLLERGQESMITTPKPQTDEELLHDFLWLVVKHIYRVASESGDQIREAAADDNPNRLRDRLVELQVGGAIRVLSLIDGTSAPSGWPRLQLVNAETGESLSDQLTWALSDVEGDFLVANGTSNQSH
jgi:hypothetical protein